MWEGDVLDFLKEKKAESIALFEKAKPVVVEKKPAVVAETPGNQLSRDELKEREKLKKKLETQLQKSEREIERLEGEIAAMDGEIAAMDYSDADASKRKLDTYAELKSKLDAVMKAWEETGNELSGL
jgi:flagellar motility protein MotE (MotC chaperone)